LAVVAIPLGRFLRLTAVLLPCGTREQDACVVCAEVQRGQFAQRHGLRHGGDWLRLV